MHLYNSCSPYEVLFMYIEIKSDYPPVLKVFNIIEFCACNFII
jgi:hypothetical protein